MGNYYETKHDVFNLKFKEHEVFKDQLVVVDESDTPFLWLNKDTGKVSFSGKYFHLYKEQRLIEAIKRLSYAAYEFVERTDEIVQDSDELASFVKRFESAIAFIEEIEQEFNKDDKAEDKNLIDVLVFQVCECDSVAAYSCDEAIAWYKEYTGLNDDELYEYDEIQIVPFDKEVWDGEERTRRITVREIVDTYWDGKPFIVTSEIC